MPVFIIFMVGLTGYVLLYAGIKDVTIISILKGKPQPYGIKDSSTGALPVKII